jgi:hypothetical protein
MATAWFLVKDETSSQVAQFAVIIKDSDIFKNICPILVEFHGCLVDKKNEGRGKVTKRNSQKPVTIGLEDNKRRTLLRWRVMAKGKIKNRA